VELPEGVYGRIAPRSGLALKFGMDVGAGVIDRDYRGEIGVILFNHSARAKVIDKGDRIAQLILEKVDYCDPMEVDALSLTKRAEGGFGSTGFGTEQEEHREIKMPGRSLYSALPMSLPRYWLTILFLLLCLGITQVDSQLTGRGEYVDNALPVISACDIWLNNVAVPWQAWSNSALTEVLVCCCMMWYMIMRPRVMVRMWHYVSLAGVKYQACIKVGLGWLANSIYWLCIWLMSLLLRLEERLLWIQAYFGKFMGLIWMALTENDWMFLGISLVKLAACCGYWVKRLLQYCVIYIFILIKIGVYVVYAVSYFLLVCGSGVQPEGGKGAWLNRGQLTRILGAAVLLTYYTDQSIVNWVGNKLTSLGLCLSMAIWQVLQVEYARWEHMWNMLGDPKLKKRIFGLRNGRSICRYQWWLGKNHDKRWLESWGIQYPAHKVAFNKHLGLGMNNRLGGIGGKNGDEPVGRTSTIKGGGGVARPGEYTNKTLLGAKKKVSKKPVGSKNKYWVGLRWLTGVDFWLFMDRHKHRVKKQVPMFSKQVMIEQLDKL